MSAFAVGQFYNHFALKTEQETKQKFLNATERIKDIQNMYRPHRKYKRKDAGPDDEQTRVRITLLEYGNKGRNILPIHLKSDSAYGTKLNEVNTNANATKGTTDDVAAAAAAADSQRNELVCYSVCF